MSQAKQFNVVSVYQQQLAGVEDALQGRDMKVPPGSWTRGGKGKKETHYEAAYRNAQAGIDLALAGGRPKGKQERSKWFRFTYYAVRALMERLGQVTAPPQPEKKPTKPARLPPKIKWDEKTGKFIDINRPKE